ncbi:hypothetical protein E2542_SST18150 [Spatholobus suberectus]|nr:hypothetical protein E2542_SST18150 [Spatholobus suberectus]
MKIYCSHHPSICTYHCYCIIYLSLMQVEESWCWSEYQQLITMTVKDNPSCSNGLHLENLIIMISIVIRIVQL